MNPAPAGTYQVKMRMGFGQIGWTERYFLLAGSLTAAQFIGSRLAFLRRYFFGAGVIIDEGSVSETRGNRKSLPLVGLPIDCPYAGIAAPNDSCAGWQYRLQLIDPVPGGSGNWFQNRLLRGVADTWVQNQRPTVTIPLGMYTGAMPIPSYSAVPNPLPSLAVLAANDVGCNLFLNALVKNTQYVHYPYTSEEEVFGTWSNITFYRVSVRRSGHRYLMPKGRFSR